MAEYRAELFSDHPEAGLNAERASRGASSFERTVDVLVGIAENPRNETPAVVVVQAPWGRGKTRALRAVEQRLGAAPAGLFSRFVARSFVLVSVTGCLLLVVDALREALQLLVAGVQRLALLERPPIFHALAQCARGGQGDSTPLSTRFIALVCLIGCLPWVLVLDVLRGALTLLVAGVQRLLAFERSPVLQVLAQCARAGQGEDGPHDASRRVSVVRFNPWKYRNEDNVLAGLLGEMLAALAREQPLAARLYRNRGRATALLPAAVSAVDKRFAGILRLFGSGEAAIVRAERRQGFSDAFRRYFLEIAWLRADRARGPLRAIQLHDHDAIEDALRERQQDQILLIMLDDLDRCPRDQVLEVLHAINQLLDTPGILFFAAMDLERLLDRVTEALGASPAGRFAERGTEARQRNEQERSEARRYLEKFLQAHVDLPVPVERSQRELLDSWLARKELGKLLQPRAGVLDTRAALLRWLQQAVGTDRSVEPRRIKQALNDFSILLARHLDPKLEWSKQLDRVHAILAWQALWAVLDDEARRHLTVGGNFESFRVRISESLQDRSGSAQP